MFDPGFPFDGQRYALKEPIGRGGMGSVYRVVHVALGREMVAKFMDPGLVSSRPDLVERAAREGRALALLESPNVVAVLDAGRTPKGVPFTVMERLQGRTLLAELHARRFLPLEEAASFAVQALRGLETAHDAGLLHRDVKPSNLFLCGDAREKQRTLKLIDFGLAKVLRGPERLGPRAFPTEQGVILGSASALSPEQARGLAVDVRADLYAVALVLYIMVAGRHPFAELSGDALLIAYAERDPPAPSRVAPQVIPPILDALVLQALARDLDSRFHDAAAFRAALLSIERELSEQRAQKGEVLRRAFAAPPGNRSEEADAGDTDRVDVRSIHNLWLPVPTDPIDTLAVHGDAPFSGGDSSDVIEHFEPSKPSALGPPLRVPTEILPVEDAKATRTQTANREPPSQAEPALTPSAFSLGPVAFLGVAAVSAAVVAWLLAAIFLRR